MKSEDVFIVSYQTSTTSVRLAWNEEASVTVEETDHTFDAEALAIGLLWNKHSQEIIEYIQKGTKP